MLTVLRFFGRLLKPVLSRTIYRPGKVARILFGPAKGLRYTIFPGYGLSMIYGGWEPDVHAVMQQYVTPGGTAYDLGANYGIYSMFLARLVGPTGRVYAFEPMPEILTQLKANIALNPLTNVEFVPMAASDSAGTAQFRIGSHAGSGHLETADQYHPISGGIINVEQITLDEFVLRGNRPPTFMKIDVEGAEGSVIVGAKRVLDEHRPVIAVEVHSADLGKQVGAALAAANYKAWRIEPGFPPVRNLISHSKGECDVAGFVLAIPTERTQDYPAK
jgi:FkbM family methyltransferase